MWVGMELMLTSQQAYEFGIGALCAWREARGLGSEGILHVAWTFNNRADDPSIFGDDWPSVCLHHYQYSCMNASDPQFKTFPVPAEASWIGALVAALGAFLRSVPDPTDKSTMYYDTSIPAPVWATDGSHMATVNLGTLRFFRVVPGRGPV